MKFEKTDSLKSINKKFDDMFSDVVTDSALGVRVMDRVAAKGELGAFDAAKKLIENSLPYLEHQKDVVKKGIERIRGNQMDVTEVNISMDDMGHLVQPTSEDKKWGGDNKDSYDFSVDKLESGVRLSGPTVKVGIEDDGAFFTIEFSDDANRSTVDVSISKNGFDSNTLKEFIKERESKGSDMNVGNLGAAA